MSTLSHWLQTVAARDRDRVTLEESLLMGQFRRYAWYRLRLFLYLRGFGLLIHIIEFTFLMHIFSQQGFGTSLIVYNGLALAGAFWWGVLDVLRNHLRQQPVDQCASDEVSRWLARAAVLALLTLVGTLGWICWDIQAVTVFHLYVFALSLRFALDLLFRTFYSGVYARRRVYRPVLAIFIIESIGFVVVVALWPVLGAWSFPLGIVCSTVASRGFVLIYTVRAYEALRFPLPRVRFPTIARGLWTDLPVMGAAGVASATTRIGSLVVIILLVKNHRYPGELVQAAHLITPLLVSVTSWPHLFYLDFKRLESSAARYLRRRLALGLRRVAIGMGIFLWIASVAILSWQMRTVDLVVPLMMGPIFIVQALLSYLQLQHFALQDYGRVSVTFVGFGCGLLLAFAGAETFYFELTNTTKPIVVTAAMACATILLFIWKSPVRHPDLFGFKKSMSIWVSCLKKVDAPVRIGLISIADSRKDRLMYMAEYLVRAVGTSGSVCLLERSKVCWYQREDSLQPLSRDQIIRVGAGLVEAITIQPPLDSGKKTLSAAFQAGILPASPMRGQNLDSLVLQCKNLFQDATVIDLARTQRRHGTLLPKPVRRALWQRAVIASERGVARAYNYDVTAYAPRGEVRVVFAVPRKASPADRALWNKAVQNANWSAG